MCGIVTEVCLAYAVVGALEDGYEVSFVADAVSGLTRETHDIAVLRLIQAGAAPNTTNAMIAQWFRDWGGELAPAAREVIAAFLNEIDLLTGTYPCFEVAKAADARAAGAGAAEQTHAAAK